MRSRRNACRGMVAPMPLLPPPTSDPGTVPRLLLLAALLALTAGVALAHDTWLLPSSLRVPVGRTVTVGLTSGMAFPADDFAIAPARVRRAVVRLAGASAPMPAPRSGARALRYVWTPRRAGIATLGVELAPRTLALTPALVAEYLDEIGASAELRATWDSMPAPRRWRERYIKHAKSFVRVAAPPASDSSWGEPIALGLELVPQSDPTNLTAGDTLVVRVLLHGDPVSSFVVGALREHEHGTPAFSRTDSSGLARVPLPAAGRWLLTGTRLRRSSVPQLEWESDFTTLTLAVAPAAARSPAR